MSTLLGYLSIIKQQTTYLMITFIPKVNEVLVDKRETFEHESQLNDERINEFEGTDR